MIDIRTAELAAVVAYGEALIKKAETERPRWSMRSSSLYDAAAIDGSVILAMKSDDGTSITFAPMDLQQVHELACVLILALADANAEQTYRHPINVQSRTEVAGAST